MFLDKEKVNVSVFRKQIQQELTYVDSLIR